MAGNPTHQVEYNYFAGLLPAEPTTCSWEEGYLQCLTSITLSGPAGSDTAYLQLVDPSGNTRIVMKAIGGGEPEDFLQVWEGLMVIGPDEGLVIEGNGVTAYCSVDGYLVAPLGSSVW
jgi:hypothetical protein